MNSTGVMGEIDLGGVDDQNNISLCNLHINIDGRLHDIGHTALRR